MRNLKSMLRTPFVLAAAAAAGSLAFDLPAAAQTRYVYSPVQLGSGATATVANRMQPIIYTPAGSGRSSASMAPTGSSTILYSPANLGGGATRAQMLRQNVLRGQLIAPGRCASTGSSPKEAENDCRSLLQCKAPQTVKCRKTTPGQQGTYQCFCAKPTPGALQVGYLGGGF